VAPECDALFGRVLDVYLGVIELAATIRVANESYIRRIIRPVLGEVKARKIGPDTLDSLNTPSSRAAGHADFFHGRDDITGMSLPDKGTLLVDSSAAASPPSNPLEGGNPTGGPLGDTIDPGGRGWHRDWHGSPRCC